MIEIWLIRADCGDYYCGCGGGHVLGVATSQECAGELADAAKDRHRSYCGDVTTSTFMKVTVEGPLTANELSDAAFGT